MFQGKSIVPCAPSPANNLYTYVDLPLTCPLQREDALRLQAFLASTYYDNGAAFKCLLSAAALALHGENVDRAFWSNGPGGVGQSLVSHLIDTTFGESHRWVDMNVYFSDDEMRKQSEQLAGALVVTGQEAPDTERRMREDIFKRHISGDPISCRLPYAVLTKMIALKGWKRFEMNELLRFAGTKEGSFMSVFRRSLVIVHKARFVSQSELQTMFPEGDAASHGYFLRDPTLKAFVTSPRAAQAFMSMLLGFKAKHDVEECRKFIDDYAEGGDGGVTWTAMRAACNLPVATSSVDGGKSTNAQVQAEPVLPSQVACPASDSRALCASITGRIETLAARSVPAALRSMEETNARRLVALVTYCLTQRKDLVTSALISRTREVWPDIKSAKDRLVAFDALVDAGLVKLLPKRGKTQPYIPVISARRSIMDILPLPSCGSLMDGLLESISLEALERCDRGCQLHNLSIIHQHLEDELATLTRRGAGIMSLQDRVRMKELKRQLAKSASHLKCVEHLRSNVQGNVRSMQHVVLSQGGDTLKRPVQYSYKFPAQGRKYAAEGGAQGMSRRARKLLLPAGVVDLDLKNAMTSLVAQAVPLLDLSLPWPAEVMGAWTEYANDTEGVRSRIREQTKMPAKSLLLAVAHGGTPPETGDDALDNWLQQLSNDARFLRWLAASQFPDLHMAMIEKGKDWPENSVFAYFWQTIEDRVLCHMERLTQEVATPNHMSLHFDGMMVQGNNVEQGSGFKERLEEHVLQETNIRVSLTYKDHLTWLEFLFEKENAEGRVEGLSGADAEFWLQPHRTVLSVIVTL